MQNFVDTFDGENDTVIASPSWTVTFYASNNFARLNGGGAVKSIAGTNPGIHRRAETSANHWAEVVLGANFAQMSYLVGVRYDTGNNGFWVKYYAAGSQLQLYRGSTNLGLLAGTTCAVGDTVRMEAEGADQIRVFINGTLVHTRTDSANAANLGVIFRVPGTATDDLIREFRSGDFISSDSESPEFTGSIGVGAKTSSTIALTLPTATDDTAVTGYQYRIDGGAWQDNGNSTAVALSGLDALTEYVIDARAYDAASNYSSSLSVTTSTYRAGALGSTILLTTGPVGENPAGMLYNDVATDGSDDDKWFSFEIITPPETGSLDINPDGTFTFVGDEAASFIYQLEVNGVPFGDPVTVSLYGASPTSERVFVKAGGAYESVSLFAKSDGGYMSASFFVKIGGAYET